MAKALEHAAKSLSRFLGDRVLHTHDVRLSNRTIAEIPALCGPEEVEMTGSAFQVDGDLSGYLLLAVPSADAERLVASLLGPMDVVPDEDVSQSAFGELANVVGSAFLNDLADSFTMRVVPSPPILFQDMIGAVLASLAGMLALEERDELPVVHAQLAGNGGALSAFLLWIPGKADWQRLEEIT